MRLVAPRGARGGSNACPDLEGIKTRKGCDLVTVIGLNACPDLEGIKTFIAGPIFGHSSPFERVP